MSFHSWCIIPGALIGTAACLIKKLVLSASITQQTDSDNPPNFILMHGSHWCSLCHLERSSWSSNLERFHSLLGSVHISGGGNSESCLPGEHDLVKVTNCITHRRGICTSERMCMRWQQSSKSTSLCCSSANCFLPMPKPTSHRRMLLSLILPIDCSDVTSSCFSASPALSIC